MTECLKILLGVILATTTWTSLAEDACADSTPEFTLYLTRHAEKTDDGDDPELSQAGRQRANWLADWALNKDIAHIWSSDYRRSRDTAQPTAERLDLPVELYDPMDLQSVALRLMEQAETTLVVGHSNTTPELAALLCQCPVTEMSDDDYDRLLAVTIHGAKRTLKEFSQQSLQAAHAND